MLMTKFDAKPTESYHAQRPSTGSQNIAQELWRGSRTRASETLPYPAFGHPLPLKKG